MVDPTRPCLDCGSFWPQPDGRRCPVCYTANNRRQYEKKIGRRVGRTNRTWGIGSDRARYYREVRKPARAAARRTCCSVCGEEFVKLTRTTMCQSCRTLALVARRTVAEARRRAAYAAGDKITWRALGDRDGWKCHLCGDKVKRVAGTAKNSMGATVDHLIPIAVGGEHKWHNVALAHRICNLQRIHLGAAQLRLV